jgi:hypothetical protein
MFRKGASIYKDKYEQRFKIKVNNYNKTPGPGQYEN